jgi:hypothetical protein
MKTETASFPSTGSRLRFKNLRLDENPACKRSKKRFSCASVLKLFLEIFCKNKDFISNKVCFYPKNLFFIFFLFGRAGFYLVRSYRIMG